MRTFLGGTEKLVFCLFKSNQNINFSVSPLFLRSKAAKRISRLKENKPNPKGFWKIETKSLEREMLGLGFGIW